MDGSTITDNIKKQSKNENMIWEDDKPNEQDLDSKKKVPHINSLLTRITNFINEVSIVVRNLQDCKSNNN